MFPSPSSSSHSTADQHATPEVARGLTKRRFINFKWGPGNDIVLFNAHHPKETKGGSTNSNDQARKGKRNDSKNKEQAVIFKMDCMLQETTQFVNKVHISFMQLQKPRNHSGNTSRTPYHLLQSTGKQYRYSLQQLCQSLQLAIESGSYLDDPLFCNENGTNFLNPRAIAEADAFLQDMKANHVTDVIYQGRKGDTIVQYAKKRGESQGMRMHGVLYDQTTNNDDENNAGDGKYNLSPSEYIWRHDLIRKLTNQLQTGKRQVGLMDDMGNAALAYVAALEQSDLMRIAWHLCEIFYWTVPPSDVASTVVAHYVADWARSGLDPLMVDDPHDPSSPEYFWSFVQRLVMRGEVSQAISVLNSSSNTDAHAIASLLSKMPTLYSVQDGIGIEQFRLHHVQWNNECKNLLGLVSGKESEKVLRILSGDESTLSSCANSWVELLLSFLLYKPTGLYIADMERLASRCLSYFVTPSRFDHLLTSIIRREHYRTLELADDCFPPFFVAHLANIFQHAGIITTSTTEGGTSISENYVMRYGISLLSHPHLWHVTADYFNFCGSFSRGLLQEVIDRQKVDHEEKFEKINQAVHTYSLFPTASLRSYAMYLHSKRRYANCIKSLLLGADQDRLLQYAEWLGLNIKKVQHSLPKIITVFETYPIPTTSSDQQQSLLNDARVAFLIQYQRFLETCKNSSSTTTTTPRITSQVQQLIGLLATAPQHLWVELLSEILHLLDSTTSPSASSSAAASSSFSSSSSPVVIGVEPTMQLMHFLTHNEGDDSPISPELGMRLRLALSHSLANSFAMAAY